MTDFRTAATRSLRAVLGIAGCVVVLAGSVSDAGSAVPSRKGLANLVADNAYPIRFETGRWSGPGADLLLEAARNAQFVALAEPHNVREIPALTRDLLAQLRERYGFGYLALEQGDTILGLACEAARAHGAEAVAEVAARFPDSFHFSTDQELRGIGSICADRTAELWGVDREISTVHALESLARVEGIDDRDREWLRVLLDEARVADEIPGLAAEVDVLSPPTLSRLASLFEERAETRALLDALRTFHEYGSLQSRAAADRAAGYRANQVRERAMKRSFARSYAKARAGGDAQPRVLLRLGHWHVGRGFNRGSVLSVGNFLVELAAFHGMEALLVNLQVVNDGGRFWTITDYPEYAALFGVADPQRSVLVDLRPLRPAMFAHRFEDSTPAMREMIEGYDAVILIGGASGGSWNWRFEAIDAPIRWTGMVERSDGIRVPVEVRGERRDGRPHPMAVRLQDGTILRATAVQVRNDVLRFVAASDRGVRYDCELRPARDAYAGKCAAGEEVVEMSIEVGSGDGS